MNKCQLWAWAAALTGGLAGTARAEPLVLTAVPVGRAAAQISARYGVAVSLQKYSMRRVTLTVDDADAPGARLQAVNALANAAGLAFTKTYVVRKATDGPGGGPPAVDSAAAMPLGERTLSAREAIAMVAGVDDASAQVAGDVGGTVTLSGSPLTVGRAAAEIAQQTGTVWETRYVLTPPAQGPDWGGTVVGHADGGAPIVQLAYVYYVDPQKEAEKQRAADAAQQEADKALAAAQTQALAEQTAAVQQVQAQRAALNAAPYGNGYAANGYVPYGGAYQNGGYGGYGSPGGYGAARAYSPAAGLTVINSGGYGTGAVTVGAGGF